MQLVGWILHQVNTAMKYSVDFIKDSDMDKNNWAVKNIAHTFKRSGFNDDIPSNFLFIQQVDAFEICCNTKCFWNSSEIEAARVYSSAKKW